MEVSSYVESLKIPESGTQLSDQFYHDCLTALGGAGEDAAMVLDDRGHILFCRSEEHTSELQSQR